MPPLVVVASPQGTHDILGRTDAFAERAGAPVARELRLLAGDNLLVVPHQQWLRRRRALQPIFTKHHVPRFADTSPHPPKSYLTAGPTTPRSTSASNATH
jgi:cytochrome P450